MIKKFTTVKNIEEYRKAVLILEYYSLKIHVNFPCKESIAISLFKMYKTLFIFINTSGELGCINSHVDAFNNFEFISYEDLITKY